jgi:hypothetical protein
MLALSARDPVLVPALSVAVRVIVKVSVPSVSPSLARVNVAVPVLLDIVIVPVNDPALKSFALMPVTV